jgi:hypothetical protein
MELSGATLFLKSCVKWAGRGGKAAAGKGGKKRMAALTAEERKDLARKAAKARGAKKKNKQS